MKRKAHYSQHYLRNPRFVATMLSKTTIGRGDHVIDIGAGSGVISSQLALKAGRVTAIEYDSDTAEKLASNTQTFKNVTVISGDIIEQPLPGGAYKVFANIPFHISSQIVQHLFFTDHPPENCYIIVQKQFAEKMIQNKRFNGMLGVQLAPWAECKILFRLERTDFWPHPNVDTVLLSIRPRTEPLLPTGHRRAYCNFVEKAYSTPAFFKKYVAPQLKDSTLKPSQLPQSQWVSYFRGDSESA